MKWVVRLIGLLLALPVLLVLLIYGASELGGEVVTLDRAQADGSVSPVRIWIADQDGRSWVEHGEPDAFWITRLAESPELSLTRKGHTDRYRGVPDRGAHELYHRLRREKYGLADRFLALLLGSADACPGVPVRLEPTG